MLSVTYRSNTWYKYNNICQVVFFSIGTRSRIILRSCWTYESSRMHNEILFTLAFLIICYIMSAKKITICYCEKTNFPDVGLFFKNISLHHADIDECAEHVCGPNTLCFNTKGSYSCACQAGFRSENHTLNCTGE